MSFEQRAISKVTEYADEPKREDFESAAEYNAAHLEWYEAQKGPQVESVPEDDVTGPGATGYVDPDTVTGPGVQ